MWHIFRVLLLLYTILLNKVTQDLRWYTAQTFKGLIACIQNKCKIPNLILYNVSQIIKKVVLTTRDDHYPACRLDIRQDSEFATGYGYPKTAFKRESDTDPDIRNAFIDIFRIQTFGKVAHCTIIHLLSSEASFLLSVPCLPVCLWCNLCSIV